MIKCNRIFSAFLILASIGTLSIASQNSSSSRTELVYDKHISMRTSPSLIKSPAGATYWISLIPDFDVERNVVVLDLVLTKPGRRNNNLFNPTGRLHGYQQYNFAASDFLHGADKSIYGDTRMIDLPQLGMTINVKVVSVKVEPTPQQSAESLPYQFNNLTLQVTAQNLTKKDTARSTE